MDVSKVGYGSKAPEVINVIIECPKGSNNKYEFDKELGMVKLDRVLFSSVFYPGDYGFIPNTLCEDGDPADAIFRFTNAFHPGVLVEGRTIAVRHMLDKGEKDDKILCVPKDDPRFAHVKDIKDVPQHTLDEIANFFATYKLLEKKKVEVLGWKGAAEAKQIIKDAIALYKKQ